MIRQGERLRTRKQLSLLLVVGLLGFGARIDALSLEEVNYYEVDDTGDSSVIAAHVREGVDLFVERYPLLVARNRAWWNSAQLSIASSHLVDEEGDRYYLRMDLDHGDDEESLRFDVDPLTIAPSDFAEALRNLVIAIEGYAKNSAPPPKLVRRFTIDAFQDVLSGKASSPVTGLAVLPNGRLILGHGAESAVVDPLLRWEDRLPVGSGLTVSASGLVIASSPDSGELVSYALPDTTARSVLTGISFVESLAWLTDGTVLVKESKLPHLVALDHGQRTELHLAEFTSPRETCLLVAGPEATFFSFHPLKKTLSWYDRNGNLLERHLACLPENSFSRVRELSLLEGGVLLRGDTFLCRLTFQGELVWFFNLDPSLGGTILDAAWSMVEQAVYLCVPKSTTVYQFADQAPTRGGSAVQKGPGANLPDYQRLVVWDQQVRTGSQGAQALRQTADYYREVGADEYALTVYQACLRLTPADSALSKVINETRLRLLLAAARTADTRTRGLLRDLGAESARPVYSEAMARYEQALALRPREPALLQARADLARALREAEAGVGSTVLPLTLEAKFLQPIFPSLMGRYRDQPLASVEFTNDTGNTATNLKASIFIPRFMDFPSESRSEQPLSDGQRFELPLVATFNQEILNVEEDLPVQARIHAEWTEAGESQSLDVTLSALIYRRTALTWDDSGKLAAFITPNEGTVGRFAMTVLQAQVPHADSGPHISLFSGRLSRVSALLDGLARHGLSYLEDPLTPVTKVLGTTEVIDTVRFPRATLLYHSGDCDDLTALACSVLESAGVPTAIVTSPGHVFFAFDSGFGTDKSWIFRGVAPVIESAGKLWIPLEATVISQGFVAAWRAAGDFVARYEGNSGLEFLPLSALRVSYPAASLPPATVEISAPSSEVLRTSFARSGSELLSLLYVANLAKLAGQGTSQWNKIGLLHSSFGAWDEAQAAFDMALKADPRSFSALINLANVSFLTGRKDKALALWKQAQALRPASTAVTALGQKLGQSVASSLSEADVTRGASVAEAVDWVE